MAVSESMAERMRLLGQRDEWRVIAEELGLAVVNEPNDGPQFAIYNPAFMGAGCVWVRRSDGLGETDLWGCIGGCRFNVLSRHEAVHILLHMHSVLRERYGLLCE